ncbi:MAG: polysaccharide ABC transporter ATP-binding protein [Flavobacteriales bacterium]
MPKAIQVENLSKLYKLGAIGTGNLSHDFQRWVAQVMGKEDPYAKIGQRNNREAGGKNDVVYSLHDVSFTVEQGDSVGIIGRNGAGKSTLLKILSRITSPTSGRVKVRGRVASLLEVGTGFHPELSGRENIFLNGAILGMRKFEIQRKLDEIIDFSGVERYIDTPVKRYSSGMYVRLAFAVAAHLEPEILIVDEVLAVGDAEFQKKCLGKMGQVSHNEGRTVLFVSHNLTAVETLCNRAIYLDQGTLALEGATPLVVKEYVSKDLLARRRVVSTEANPIGNDQLTIQCAEIIHVQAGEDDALIDVSSEVQVQLTVVNHTKEDFISAGFDLKTAREDVVFGSGSKLHAPIGKPTVFTCTIPGHFLNDDLYQLDVYFHTAGMSKLYAQRNMLSFEVKDITRENGFLGKINGMIRPQLKWESTSST